MLNQIHEDPIDGNGYPGLHLASPTAFGPAASTSSLFRTQMVTVVSPPRDKMRTTKGVPPLSKVTYLTDTSMISEYQIYRYTMIYQQTAHHLLTTVACLYCSYGVWQKMNHKLPAITLVLSFLMLMCFVQVPELSESM